MKNKIIRSKVNYRCCACPFQGDGKKPFCNYEITKNEYCDLDQWDFEKKIRGIIFMTKDRKMTKKQFIQKCAWEGGSLTNGFDYGLRSTHLDDKDKKFKEMIQKAEEFYLNFKIEEEKIYEEFGCFEEQEE